MLTIDGSTRSAAAIIAVLAAAGLWMQFAVVFESAGSVGATIWALSKAFTICANVWIVLLFAYIALGAAALPPRALAAGALLMFLVGAAHALLANGFEQHAGRALAASVLLHDVTPVLVLLFWFVFAPKGALSFLHPIVWAIYPAVFLDYVLVRGGVDANANYPYTFLDVPNLGWLMICRNIAIAALAYLATGLAIVWLDRLLARRGASSVPST